jgi:hypothetical protein
MHMDIIATGVIIFINVSEIRNYVYNMCFSRHNGSSGFDFKFVIQLCSSTECMFSQITLPVFMCEYQLYSGTLTFR